MKKIIVFLTALFVFSGIAAAYEPLPQDTMMMSSTKKPAVKKVIKKKKHRKYKRHYRKIPKVVKGS